MSCRGGVAARLRYGVCWVQDLSPSSSAACLRRVAPPHPQHHENDLIHKARESWRCLACFLLLDERLADSHHLGCHAVVLLMDCHMIVIRWRAFQCDEVQVGGIQSTQRPWCGPHVEINH